MMHIRDTLYIRQIKHMNGYMTLPSDYDLGEREGGLQRPGPLLWRAIGEASRPTALSTRSGWVGKEKLTIGEIRKDDGEVSGSASNDDDDDLTSWFVYEERPRFFRTLLETELFTGFPGLVPPLQQ